MEVVAVPMQYCDTMVMGHGSQQVGNSQYHTHTCRPCDLNTVGFTVPMLFPRHNFSQVEAKPLLSTPLEIPQYSVRAFDLNQLPNSRPK